MVGIGINCIGYAGMGHAIAAIGYGYANGGAACNSYQGVGAGIAT